VLGQLGAEALGHLDQIPPKRRGRGLMSGETITDDTDGAQRRGVLAGEPKLDRLMLGVADAKLPVQGRKQCRVLGGLPGNRDLQGPGWQAELPGADGHRADFGPDTPADRPAPDLDPELTERLPDHVVKLEAQDRGNVFVAALDVFGQSNRLFHGRAFSSALLATVASAGDGG
jgi:hypothetical protein